MKLSLLGKLFFLILGYAFLIAACKATPTPESPLADRSFLTDQPCAAPCWHGLEIGKSTEEDVYKIIKQLPFIVQTNIRESQTSFGEIADFKSIGFRCIYNPEVECGGFFNLQRKISTYQPAYRLQVNYQASR